MENIFITLFTLRNNFAVVRLKPSKISRRRAFLIAFLLEKRSDFRMMTRQQFSFGDVPAEKDSSLLESGK